MKTLNCDQVFDVLTRGPFPTGEAIDAPVERHLAACHECRALAEALRPAVELFHEAIDPEECRDLPGYHGVGASSAAGGLAQMVAQAIENDSPPRAASLPVAPRRVTAWSRLTGYRPSQLEAFLAALAVGALFVLSLAGFGGFEAPTAPPAVAITPTSDGLMQLAALELRPACFSWSQGSSASSLHCCTECHAAKGERALSKPTIAVLTASCRACHR